MLSNVGLTANLQIVGGWEKLRISELRKKLVTGFGAIVSIQTEKLRTFLFNFSIVVPFEKMDDECFLLWSVMEGELFESNMIFCVGLVLCPLTKGSEHGEVPVDFWWWCVTGGCSVVKWVGGTSNGDEWNDSWVRGGHDLWLRDVNYWWNNWWKVGIGCD